MTRGNRTNVVQQVEDLFRAHPRVEWTVNKVAEHLGFAPNTVGQKVLSLFDAGVLLRRMEGVARGRHYVYVLNPKPALDEGQQVWYDDTCGKVESVYEAGRYVNVLWGNGTRSTVERSDLLTHAEYVAMQPLPHARYDMSSSQIVKWEDLPTWVKGGADRGDMALKFAKASTWLQVDDEVFYQFSPLGTYEQVWARE